RHALAGRPGAAGAIEAELGPARARTAVTADVIAVIAELGRGEHAVAAARFRQRAARARPGRAVAAESSGAAEAWLDPARARTAVAARRVAVIAALVAGDDAVPAPDVRHARLPGRRADKVDADGTVAVAAVERGPVAVVALLDALAQEAIPAELDPLARAARGATHEAGLHGTAVGAAVA